MRPPGRITMPTDYTKPKTTNDTATPTGVSAKTQPSATRQGEPDNLPDAQRRDLAPKGRDSPPNPSTGGRGSPSQRFGKMALEQDPERKTITFRGDDGSTVTIDQSDFDAMVAAHKDDADPSKDASPVKQ